MQDEFSPHFGIRHAHLGMLSPDFYFTESVSRDSKPGRRLKTFPGPWIIQGQLQMTRLDRTLDCLIKPNILVKPSRAQQHHEVSFHLGFLPSGLEPPVDFTDVFPPFWFWRVQLVSQTFKSCLK